MQDGGLVRHERMFASRADTFAATMVGTPSAGPKEVSAMNELGATSSITIDAPIDEVWKAITTPS